MATSDDWVEIVPAMAPDEARHFYDKWMADQVALGHEVADEHVRIDHLLGADGFNEVRYLVMHKAFT